MRLAIVSEVKLCIKLRVEITVKAEKRTVEIKVLACFRNETKAKMYSDEEFSCEQANANTSKPTSSIFIRRISIISLYLPTMSLRVQQVANKKSAPLSKTSFFKVVQAYELEKPVEFSDIDDM